MELLIKLVECLNFSIFPVLFFSIVALVCKYIKTGNRLAPGPMGLPYLGYFLFLRDNFPKEMNRLSKRYGPVFRITIGSSNMIILSSIGTIKEAFRKPEFSGRPRSKPFDMFQGYGITNISGPKWQVQRKFLYTQLRSLGMKIVGPNREKLEGNIMDEVLPLLSTLKASKGNSFNPDPYFTLVVSNLLSTILMSKKFKSNHPDYIKMAKLNSEGFDLFAKADIATKVSFMKYIPQYGNAFDRLQENFEAEKKIIMGYIADIRDSFSPEDAVDDIVTAYLSAEYKSELEGESVSTAETDRQIIQVVMDLYSGGSETMKTCLNWAFLILLHYPEAARRIQEELDDVVGRERLPTLEDMISLEYTRAAISEILRFATIIPLAMHSAARDTTVGGYFVPKGTLVISNHYSCHANPILFPNPDKFMPERFIDSSGRYFRPDGFVAFGWGQRICIGEIMAKSELFLIVSCILHAFNIAKSDTSQFPDLQETFTFSNNPKQYEMRFIPRDDLSVEIDERLSEYGTFT